MNKQAAIEYMVGKVEEIEKNRMASHMSIDATKHKKETVDCIIKVLKELEIEDEN